MTTTTPIAPMPIHTEKPFTSPGAMFAPEIQELEARLPRQLLNALEAIGRQMDTEIFKPLLRAPDFEKLTEEFTRAFQRYASLSISVSLLLWSEIGDLASLARIWTPMLAGFKIELERRGVETIGEEATNDTLVGLATIGLVNRKLLESAQAGSEVGDLNDLQGWAIAYWMACSCVYSYHLDRDGSQENVRVLAYWNRCYAARLYQHAKSLSIVKVPVGKGQVPEPSEEDRLLSEAGLDDFAERLAQEDRDES